MIEVECPNIIKLYNIFMGGVDLADCLIKLYQINLRTKKYYFRLIFYMIDGHCKQAGFYTNVLQSF